MIEPVVGGIYYCDSVWQTTGIQGGHVFDTCIIAGGLDSVGDTYNDTIEAYKNQANCEYFPNMHEYLNKYGKGAKAFQEHLKRMLNA